MKKKKYLEIKLADRNIYQYQLNDPDSGVYDLFIASRFEPTTKEVKDLYLEDIGLDKRKKSDKEQADYFVENAKTYIVYAYV